MSVVTNNILKLLRDLSASADKIVEENASEAMLTRVSEWICIVKNKACSIVESNSGTQSGEIPTLMSFAKGTSQRGPRISTVLTGIQKSHLHKKGKASIKARKSRRSSVKTPIERKSNVIDTNETFSVRSENSTPKLNIPPIIDKAELVLNQNSSGSTSTIRVTETPVTTFTRVNREGISRKVRSSKRKSSSELSQEIIKKPKINGDELSDSREREKLKQNAKAEKLVKAKKSSLLPNYANIKSSIGANASVLKENRTLRAKMETKQEKAVENKKNILALRQQKLQQNKKTREEKLEKTLQRMKLEKEKLSKLRSGGREKALTNVNKEATPKAMQKTNAENENLGETSKSLKNREKQTSLKMLKMNLKKTDTSLLRSNEKTPFMKNSKHEADKIMNTTYVAQGEQPSTSNKGKMLKGANIGTNQGNTKDVSNASSTQTLTHTKGTKTVPKKPVKPLIEQKKQLINAAITSTPVQKKALESYDMTPARSSFVSYDISEIRSDSEEEEQQENSKQIPSWATGVRLRNALLQQHHQTIDTDELFGNFFDPPDLAALMGVKKKHYNKRTSSAVWNSSFL